MYIPTISTILASAFLIFLGHSMWSMTQLFRTLTCKGDKNYFPCYKSFLATNPKLQLAIFITPTINSACNDVVKVDSIRNVDYYSKLHRNLEVEIPAKTRRNGSLYMLVVLASDDFTLDWNNLQRDGPLVMQRISLTEFMIPKTEAFNLLQEKNNISFKESEKSRKSVKAVSHFCKEVHIVILTDNISMSRIDIPVEISSLVRINRHNEFLPIIYKDFFQTRLDFYEEITKETKKMNLSFYFSPISIGKLRLMLQIDYAAKHLQSLGFNAKDIDEIKGIFSGTNVYLLCATVFVGGIHLLFDFLALKNDVSFWRKKRSYVGLSARTTLWRGFSQVVIFFYLLNEETSLLVLVPAFLGAVIELWKCKKIFKVNITFFGIQFDTNKKSNKELSDENETNQFDKEGMKYLSYLLYPLCIGGALFSLIYQSHKSWYSWSLNSLVNGVYAFGFLFMLPQLFVNYKLKSVAALPWRAFMYKAFNTFIDDIFAFIITMPTAHRVACFRDDIVFIIYLYQRWLYPVDKNRIDSGCSFDEIDDTKNNFNKEKISKNKKQQ